MSESDDPPDRTASVSPASRLQRRHLAALVVVALLVILNQVLIQPALRELTSDAPVINLAGRQRMLSQRLAKASLALAAAETASERGRHRQELDQVLKLWSASHIGLRHGNPALGLPGRNSAAVQAAFTELEPLYSRMREAAARLIRSDPDAPEDQRDLTIILGAEADYLERMDRIVGLFESEARARVDRLVWTGRAVAGVILIVLLAIGLFLLRPAAQLIRRQFRELAEARDVLEDRVQERTRELARAAEERAQVEARHRTLLEQFSHVSRTTTLGEMASSLAHELNQPLGAIANYAEGCLVELDFPHPALDEVRTALEKLLATTLRAGQVLQRIRRFVTRHEIAQEPFEPNRVVEEVEALLRDEARQRGLVVALDLAPDLPILRGDPIQVQQVLVNLARNAFEAIASAQVSEPQLLIFTRKAGPDAVEFGVSDQGEGIPPENLGRIFDAYFSTRAGGMGMGLAISRSIVEAHHGRLSVESELGAGTTFRFLLPAAGHDDAGSDGLHRG